MRTLGGALGPADQERDRMAKMMKTWLVARQPIQRAGLPEDIARAALWLASDDSSFVNGHALIVDGGLTGGRMWAFVREQRQQLRQALGLGEERRWSCVSPSCTWPRSRAT